MSALLARAISILGHPLVMLPIAALALALRQMERAQVLIMAAGMGVFVVLVMGWSWWQVRRGQWRHVDASGQAERRTLNRFLLLALSCSAALAVIAGLPRALALGLALSALLIVIAQLTARWCKLSLHLAFVVYAAMLLWQIDMRLGLATCGFAVLVAWSRLVLERHQLRDVIAGAIAGGCAGAVFAWLAPQLPG